MSHSAVMQDDRRILIPLLLAGSFAAVTLLHIAAAWRERETRPAAGGWIAVGPRSPFRTNAPASSSLRMASASRCSATAARSAR